MDFQDSLGTHIQDYQRGDLLGKGGFACVYKARCKYTGKEVALKVMSLAKIRAKRVEDKVNEEVCLHSQLNHPGIVSLYKYFKDEDNVYLVLELCHNGDLENYVKNRECLLTETEVAIAMQPVLQGLVYLHFHQIMHRDIKLANLLVTATGSVKIGDFSLATQLRSPTDSHKTMCGTPNYISPEVAGHGWQGPPVDMWGIGVAIHMLLTGLPINDSTEQMQGSDYKAPEFLSAEARDLLHKLLRRDPLARITAKQALNHPFMNRVSLVDSGLCTMNGTLGLSTLRHQQSVPVLYDGGGLRGLQPVYKKLSCPNVFQHRAASSSVSVAKLSQRGQSVHVTGCDQASNCTCRCLRQCPGEFSSHVVSSSTGTIRVNGQEVLPLTTTRLPAYRQSKHGKVITLLEGGEVVVESLKKSTVGTTACRVLRCCRISKDGMNIVVYPVNSPLRDRPPDPPTNVTNYIHSYTNLPSKYWKDYYLAAQLVSLMKRDTVRITYYSDRAKCDLMETSPVHFRASFFDGSKVCKDGDAVQVGSRVVSMEHSSNWKQQVDSETLAQLTHFKQCFEYCLQMDEAISCVQERLKDMKCFPIVFGKPPKDTQSSKAPSKPSVSLNTPSQLQPRAQSTPRASLNRNERGCKEKYITGMGLVSQLTTGHIKIVYDNGESFIFDQKTNAVKYKNKTWSIDDGRTPEHVRVMMGDVLKAAKELSIQQVPASR